MFKGSAFKLSGILLIILATVVVITLCAVGEIWIYLLIAIPVLLFSISALYKLHYQNIRKMTFMFNSIENRDYAFKFTEYEGPISDNLLNISLNRIKDILVKAKIETEDKEKYYELILDSVNTGVIVLNDTGNVYQINDEALRLIGLPRLTHVNQLEVIDPSIRELFSTLKSGEKKHATYSNERGTLHLSISTSELTIRGRRLRIIAISDINKELDEKETESWIRLIRVLTHEIMNSITPITSLSDTLLSTDKPSDAELREGLEVINSTSKSLTNFVQSYRKITRIPTPQLASFYVGPFLERIGKLVNALDGNSRIDIDVRPTDLLLYADEDLIGQVVLNLLKNAMHAIDGKKEGVITVTADSNASEQVYIEITDNGAGIPPEIAENIFVPFFTTKENGSGIGLSVSRQIMRMHSGSISLKCSRPGRTTFVLLFN